METACVTADYNPCLGRADGTSTCEDDDGFTCEGDEVTAILFKCVANSTNSIVFVEKCEQYRSEGTCEEPEADYTEQSSGNNPGDFCDGPGGPTR